MTDGGLARYAAAIVIAVVTVWSPAARAGDRVTELAQLMTSSSNEKARLAAVVALAKIGSKPTLKPLVTALGDPSPKIRQVAAVALGRLGHKAALPALRSAANDDADDVVRKNARDAAVAVARANRLPDPFAPEGVAAEQPRKKAKAGFGDKPRQLDPGPDLFVQIKSSSDDSPGSNDKAARKEHADIIRRSLADQCKAQATVTSIASEAARYGLPLRNIDLSVVKLDVARSGGYVEVEAQLRLAISDDKGKMLSFLSGGAKVQVPAKSFNARYLPNMRREALENAMRGMFQKLIDHLREKPKA